MPSNVLSNVSPQPNAQYSGWCVNCGHPVPGVWSEDHIRPDLGDTEHDMGFPKTWTWEDLQPGQAAVSEPLPCDDTTNPPLRVLYSTQTGTAEEYAKRFVSDARSQGFNAVATNFSKYDLKVLGKESRVALIVATQGEGDAPDSGVILDQLFKTSSPNFKSVEFSVFGLGRRAYKEHWASFGLRCDVAMERCGGVRVADVAKGDDSEVGQQEADFEAWSQKAIRGFCTAANLTFKEVEEDFTPRFYFSRHAPEDVFVEPEGMGDSPESTVTATMTDTEPLQPADADRDTRHLTFHLPQNVQCRSGDHLCIYPQNDRKKSHWLCERLDIPANTVFSLIPKAGIVETSRFPQPTVIQDAFMKYIDITSPCRRGILRLLAHFAESKLDKLDLHVLATSEYSRVLEDHITIVDCLRDFPSVHPPPESILALLPKLAPRYYSVAGTDDLGTLPPTQTAELVVAPVTFNTPLGVGHGLCSNYLIKARKGTKMKVFLKESQFHLPPDSTAPIIMVAAGCGIAPLRGFVKERRKILEAGGTLGPALLFFGCRTEGCDFLFRNEIAKAVDDGVISGLRMAFSRDDPNKKEHVTARLAEAVEDLEQFLIAQPGHFYICGNSRTIGESVRELMKHILDNMKNKPSEISVENLKSAGRWHEDLFAVT